MLQRFAHIALAALILVSSSGLLLNKHYCQGELRSVAVFAKPKTCHEVARQHNPASGHGCPLHRQMAATAQEDKGCCDNRSAFLKITDQQVLPDLVQKVVAPVFLPVFTVPAVVLFSNLPDYRRFPSTWAFDLPPPKVPLRILFQTFRN